MPSKASQYRECRLPEQTGTGSLFSVGKPTRQEHQSPRIRAGVQSSLERQRRDRARGGTLRRGAPPPPPPGEGKTSLQRARGSPLRADRRACSSNVRPFATLSKTRNLRRGCQHAARPSPEGGEPVDKPGSVASNHSSRAVVADCLVRPTRDRRGPRHRPPIWPCSRRECLAGPVARARGALLPHPFTLAGRAKRLAVCSLLHLPQAYASQGLPGALSCGARTFLEPPCAKGFAPTREDARLLDRLSKPKPTPFLGAAARRPPAHRVRCAAGR